MDVEHPIDIWTKWFRERGWLSPKEAEELGREHKAKELQWAEEAEKLWAQLDVYHKLGPPSPVPGYLAPEPARRLVEAAEMVRAVYDSHRWPLEAIGRALPALRDALADPAVKALKP